MNIVNPINFLGRFGWRDLQINHNRFLAATHEHTAQRFLPAWGLDQTNSGYRVQNSALVWRRSGRKSRLSIIGRQNT